MIQSMTGFGKAVTELNGKKISVEIKSLNSKQLDLNARIPSAYREKEIEIRNILSQFIERGKVDFTLTIENTDIGTSSKISTGAIRSYYEQIKEAAEKINIEPPSDWFSVILRLPETVKTETNELDENEWATVKKTIIQAFNALRAFRIQEGIAIERDLREKIDLIRCLLLEIEKYDSERIEKIRTRIMDSIKRVEIVYDENRFEQELLYYIERLDVNEEKIRLENHLKYFIETMDGEKNQGRKLGFIAQEIGREINTLGSKSNQADMQKIVVQMKDELEQIKEQILNVL
jgi:uncharacterized protein (TIGR00255 family)